MQHPAEYPPLDKTSEYVSSYTPSLLFPIPRTAKWAGLGLSAETLPYCGVDIWNYYEPSWLTPTDKLVAAIDEFSVPADSLNIIGSGSFKLYLNPFNQPALDSRKAFRTALKKDLPPAAGAPAGACLRNLGEVIEEGIRRLPGRCIDELGIAVDDCEQPRLELLRYDAGWTVEGQLCSHLLKPNCSVTGQLNWGILVADYQSPVLDPASLLVHLVSFRQHQDFHEQCVEHIFLDLQRLLQSQMLSIYARYVRRDDLGINPYRSPMEVAPDNQRLVRQ